MKKRPPIIVILGHVDHGKTTLLDKIRKTNIAEKELGGITQNIGAYEIIYENQKITFIDTPGHEAFSKIRENGAKIADLAILLIAADDGLMPQTKESIEILKKTNTPFIVAINKIDKIQNTIEKIKQQLAENNIFLEGYGGNISWQPISAKTGENIDKLLELIILSTEIQDLKYDEHKNGKGFIITAKKDSKKGNIVSVILTDGTLKKGDIIETKTAFGKIKILENFLGKKEQIMYPSSPSLIYGFEILPQIGEDFFTHQNEKILKEKKQIFKKNKTLNIQTYLEKENKNQNKKINIILRADEKNSLFALEKLIENFIKNNLPLKIIDSDIGNIHEQETKLAETFNAIIIGFKTKIDKTAQNLIKIHDIKVINHDIIYEIEKDLKYFFEKNKETITGELKILAIFNNKKNKHQIIGGKVILGEIYNKTKFEIFKNEEKIGEGKIINLQINKKDAEKAIQNQEIGLLVESDLLIELNHKLIFKK